MLCDANEKENKSNENIKKIKDAFYAFDVDGTGYICKKELKYAMHFLGFTHKNNVTI
jgi:Ca2+-binding EF-hand superfamily protein